MIKENLIEACISDADSISKDHIRAYLRLKNKAVNKLDKSDEQLFCKQ